MLPAHHTPNKVKDDARELYQQDHRYPIPPASGEERTGLRGKRLRVQGHMAKKMLTRAQYRPLPLVCHLSCVFLAAPDTPTHPPKKTLSAPILASSLNGTNHSGGDLDQ